MKNKFLNAEFGYCPRVLCDRQIVLPIAMSEDLSISRVKVYCPKCEDVYVPRSRFVDIDGAYFGKSFPNIFFQTFPDLMPKEKMVRLKFSDLKFMEWLGLNMKKLRIIKEIFIFIIFNNDFYYR